MKKSIKKLTTNQLKDSEMKKVMAGLKIRIGNWTMYDDYYEKGNRWWWQNENLNP